MMPITHIEARNYDEFIGLFVDAVQTTRSEYQALRDEWLGLCPSRWKKRFRNEAGEIQQLVSDGAFARDLMV